jgi:hypothetical protein
MEAEHLELGRLRALETKQLEWRPNSYDLELISNLECKMWFQNQVALEC